MCHLGTCPGFDSFPIYSDKYLHLAFLEKYAEQLASDERIEGENTALDPKKILKDDPYYSVRLPVKNENELGTFEMVCMGDKKFRIETDVPSLVRYAYGQAHEGIGYENSNVIDQNVPKGTYEIMVPMVIACKRERGKWVKALAIPSDETKPPTRSFKDLLLKLMKLTYQTEEDLVGNLATLYQDLNDLKNDEYHDGDVVILGFAPGYRCICDVDDRDVPCDSVNVEIEYRDTGGFRNVTFGEFLQSLQNASGPYEQLVNIANKFSGERGAIAKLLCDRYLAESCPCTHPEQTNVRFA